MALPCNFADLIFAKIEPPECGKGNYSECFDLIAWYVEELQLVKTFLVEVGQVTDLIFRCVEPQKTRKLVHDWKISDCVCVKIKIAYLFEFQYHWEEPFYFFLSYWETSVCYAAIVSCLSKCAEPTLKCFLQFLQILFCFDSGFFFSFPPFLLFQTFLLLSLLEFLFELLGGFLDRWCHLFLVHLQLYLLLYAEIYPYPRAVN